MLKPKPNSKRLIIMIGLIFVAAVIGLATLNTVGASAQQSLADKRIQSANNSEAGATTAGVTNWSSEKSPVGSMSATSSILKMVSALFVVVICIYGAVYALKKIMGRRATGRGSNGILEVLETAHLGPKKMVSVVRIADRSVLIGVTDNQISLLTELDESQTAEIVAVDERPPGSRSFVDLLRSATTKIKELSTSKPQTALAGK